MRYFATIQVEQTYEVEADTPEEAEEYFRARWISRKDEAVNNFPNWDTLEIEEV